MVCPRIYLLLLVLYQPNRAKPPNEPERSGCVIFMCTIYKFVCSDCFFYFLSEKEAKIAKEKALGIYKERKVTADGLKNCEIRAGIFV